MGESARGKARPHCYRLLSCALRRRSFALAPLITISWMGHVSQAAAKFSSSRTRSTLGCGADWQSVVHNEISISLGALTSLLSEKDGRSIISARLQQCDKLGSLTKIAMSLRLRTRGRWLCNFQKFDHLLIIAHFLCLRMKPNFSVLQFHFLSIICDFCLVNNGANNAALFSTIWHCFLRLTWFNLVAYF